MSKDVRKHNTTQRNECGRETRSKFFHGFRLLGGVRILSLLLIGVVTLPSLSAFSYQSEDKETKERKAEQVETGDSTGTKGEPQAPQGANEPLIARHRNARPLSFDRRLTKTEINMNDQQVLLKLVRVKCLDETGNGPTVEKLGNDEIALSGFGINATGKTVMLPPFTVYPHFDDGEVKEFSPPKTILTLNVPNDGAFPKRITSSLILAELDSGGFSEVAQKAFTKLTEQVEGIKQRKMNSGLRFADINWREVWNDM